LLVGRFCGGGFGFQARELVRIFVGLFDEFARFGAQSVVVEEFMVALFDA
jgi:hypothetical protein